MTDESRIAWLEADPYVRLLELSRRVAVERCSVREALDTLVSEDMRLIELRAVEQMRRA